jgi:hypothetical protein
MYTTVTLNTWPCLATTHHSTSSQLLQLTNCPCCYICLALHCALFLIKLAKSQLYICSSAICLPTWACHVMRQAHLKLRYDVRTPCWAYRVFVKQLICLLRRLKQQLQPRMTFGLRSRWHCVCCNGVKAPTAGVPTSGYISWTVWPFKVKALRFFETSVTTSQRQGVTGQKICNPNSATVRHQITYQTRHNKR